MIGDAGSAGNIVSIQEGFVILLVCAVLLGITSAYRFYMVSWLGGVVIDIKKRLFEHIMQIRFMIKTKRGSC